MADIQAGIGPFLGVFLLAHGWASGLIGTVMTIGGIAGMIMTTPAGALIDVTTNKRAYVIIPGICTVIASAIILVSQSFWVVAASQVATAIAGAAIVPAVTGITLGIVHQAGFNRQNGRNQAFNHAGNMVGAALSGRSRRQDRSSSGVVRRQACFSFNGRAYPCWYPSCAAEQPWKHCRYRWDR
jgi:predicted MFS family arabinose efflux permease